MNDIELRRHFFKRFEAFKKDLINKVSREFGNYFMIRNEGIDFNAFSHWLWYYVKPDTATNGGKPIAVLFLTNDGKLTGVIVDFIEDIFTQHFEVRERNPIMRTCFMYSTAHECSIMRLGMQNLDFYKMTNLKKPSEMTDEEFLEYIDQLEKDSIKEKYGLNEMGEFFKLNLLDENDNIIEEGNSQGDER